MRSAKTEHAGGTAFCKVVGEIVSVDPAAQAIRFEVNLPEKWNGKAVHFGGGGFDGSLKKARGLGTPEVGIKADPTPLDRGFATFGSDSGHHHHYLLLPDIYNELKANFAANAEERRNYAHDALKKTHDVAVEVMRRRYAKPPSRMFFLGGSTGGREAYFVTQLWPEDYDGVLGAYAGWNQVQLDLQFIRVTQAEYSAGGWLPKGKTRLVARKAMEACDAADGLRDGMISDPAGCRFDPATLACPVGGKGKDCLTPGELRTVQVFGSEQRTAEPLMRGVQTIPGFNVAKGTDLTGSLGLFRHHFQNPVYPFNSFYDVVGTGVLRYFLTGDPHFSAIGFDTTTGGKYAKDLLPQSEASDASDADLSRFAGHGGKFLMVHGTTDATIPTGSTEEFYGMMRAKMGQEAVDKFARFYLVPGFGHGHGVFNAGFDALGVLDKWVESGVAPENLVAVDNNKGNGARTRPLCAYPTWPSYVGGDPRAAASFGCRLVTDRDGGEHLTQ